MSDTTPLAGHNIGPHPAVLALLLREEAERIHRSALGTNHDDEWHAKQWAMNYLLNRADELTGRTAQQENPHA